MGRGPARWRALHLGGVRIVTYLSCCTLVDGLWASKRQISLPKGRGRRVLLKTKNRLVLAARCREDVRAVKERCCLPSGRPLKVLAANFADASTGASARCRLAVLAFFGSRPKVIRIANPSFTDDSSSPAETLDPLALYHKVNRSYQQTARI